MNEYTKDGMRWLKRASEQIPPPSSNMISGEYDLETKNYSADKRDDSILFFALGVEKLLKGILYDVNPLFVFEKIDIENIAGVLYKNKMTQGSKASFEQRDADGKISRQVHTGMASLTRVTQFSQVACDHTAAIRQLFGFRGTIAHRPSCDLSPGCVRFVQKLFSPLVEAFVAELKLEPTSLFADGKRQTLANISAAIAKADDFESAMKKLIDEHKKKWGERQKDEKAVELANDRTTIELQVDYKYQFTESTVCPACEQKAILVCQIEGEYMDGEAVTTGAFVSELKCHYCDLVLKGPEQIDHFELDRKLYDLLIS